MTSEKPEFFGKEHAAHYDKSSQGLSALKDALHLIAKTSLIDLPDESDILCVGAGTGAELIALAQNNPGWRFTALDTSEAMLDVCKEKISKEGLVSRCNFHLGSIDTLMEEKKYDAATSILVSQFLTNKADRIAFFEKIRSHLKPCGYLINADLARPVEDHSYKPLMEHWFKMHRFNGMSEEQAKSSTALWDEFVSVLKPQEVEALLMTGGFTNPLLVFQVFFIHAWVCQLP